MVTGRYAEARARCLEYATVTGSDPTTMLAIVDALENPEMTGKAISLMEQSPALPDGALGKASYLMMLNEPELALDSLEIGFAKSDGYMVHMNRMDIYDPLRENPRFQALLAKMNMWP